MQIKTKGLILFFLLIGMMIICFWTFLVVRVNSKYSTPVETIHQMKKELSVPKTNNLSFVIEKSTLLSPDEVKKKVPSSYNHVKEIGLEEYLVAVDIVIKNKSTIEAEKFSLTNAMLTMNNNYTNGVDLIATTELNGEQLDSTVAPNSQKKVTFLYGVLDRYLTRLQFQHLSDQTFYLTYLMVPTIERVQLKFS
ncbi:hypothetical protein IGI37_002719 [Enterococcus sp. AZ194]|uniref:hypothetical protein n=1 Tax=Enterococcus sp. AZ194 TaxID=2774629 RepID=UPI003F1F7A45